VFGTGVSEEKKHMSRGGMSAKLEAIKVATKASVPAIIANGEMDNVLLRALAGERVGTLFMESEEKLISRRHWISFGVKPTTTPIPSPTITIIPTVVPKKQPQQAPSTSTDKDWGVAKQVGEHTYTINVGNDDHMTSPQEVFQALNSYRAAKGSSQLSWDDKLAQYSQGRAYQFKNIGTVDSHAGFNSFLENENGFEKMGYMRLGENSYYGGPLNGTHLIEWVFSQSPGHDANQLDNGWSHVGVGVTDTSVNLVFGGEKM
jgi:uncharacterized protein YkwD